MIKVEMKEIYYIEENGLKENYNDYVDETNDWNKEHPDNPDKILPYEEWAKEYIEEGDLCWLDPFHERTIEKITFEKEP